MSTEKRMETLYIKACEVLEDLTLVPGFARRLCAYHSLHFDPTAAQHRYTERVVSFLKTANPLRRWRARTPDFVQFVDEETTVDGY